MKTSNGVKILIATPLFPPDIGGPATYSRALLEELPKRGISVDILSFGAVRNLPKIIRHSAYFWKVFWHGRKTDIIYAQDSVSVGFPSALAALILRKSFVLKIVGDYAWEQGINRFGVKDLLDNFLEKKYNWPVEFLRRVERFVAGRADKIITPSEYLKRVVVKWDVNPDKIKVIYNSIYFSDILENKAQLRRELNLSGRILVSVGRLVSWKGFEMLIELMPEISKKYPDTQLLIIGSGPEENKLKAKSYRLKARADFLGSLPRDRVLKYLKAADIFLLNTGYEGFSHQILEAMAVGAPTISTQAGGNEEILRNRQNALIAGYNDKKAWFETISEFLNNPAFAQNLAENAKKDIQKLSGQNMIEETIKIFQNFYESRN